MSVAAIPFDLTDLLAREYTRVSGLGCPTCGSGASRVLSAWNVPGARRRRRCCRLCGRVFASDERPVDPDVSPASHE